MLYVFYAGFCDVGHFYSAELAPWSLYFEFHLFSDMFLPLFVKAHLEAVPTWLNNLCKSNRSVEVESLVWGTTLVRAATEAPKATAEALNMTTLPQTQISGDIWRRSVGYLTYLWRSVGYLRSTDICAYRGCLMVDIFYFWILRTKNPILWIWGKKWLAWGGTLWAFWKGLHAWKNA